MIVDFIWKRRREVLFSVRELSQFAVCPLLFLREKVMPRKRSKEMERGAILHNEAYQRHRERAVEMSVEEAVERSHEERMVGREIWLDNGVLGGYADLVIIENRKATVIELKSSERSARWPGAAVQALGYAVLLSPLVKEVKAAVATFDGRLFWERKVREGERDFVEGALRRMWKSVLEGLFKPSPGPHCLSCPYRKTCPVFKEGDGIILEVGVSGHGRRQL
ncbi:MAG: Dna2/Cas4 domain-containing protein [Candidatus Diapherotrites archaeon]|nr:Dna2/Cas4 domain-containing protein [Candidatus Diapherotrites archaeon]